MPKTTEPSDLIKILKGHRILGVDPGSRVAGFALIEATCAFAMKPKDFRIIELGVINVKSTQSMPERLGQMHQALFNIITKSKPHVFAIEKAFVGNNASSALKLGEARGALTCAARRHELSVYEITPAEVKKIITGSGTATKEDLKIALGRLLGFTTLDLPYDASDALAVALSFALGLALTGPSQKRGRSLMSDVARKMMKEV